eukprot:SAG31_NODE_1282_length_9017_cov_10.333146_1_plen_59_part_00
MYIRQYLDKNTQSLISVQDQVICGGNDILILLMQNQVILHMVVLVILTDTEFSRMSMK